MHDGTRYDANRLLDVAQVKRGWHGATKEYDYWVPEADIEGTLPADLKGTLFRNGPGLDEIYGTRLVHPIDGDGMVIALTFVEGRVHLRSRFVATKERLEEQAKGAMLYPGQMGTRPHGVLRNMVSIFSHVAFLRWPKLRFRNPSNTNVLYWGGKVLSFYETGLPHCLDPVTLDTLGLDDMNGVLKLKALAAHFRMDIKNMLLVCMSIKPALGSLPPVLAIYEFDNKWNLVQEQTHHITGLNYSHDFVLLPDYYVFHMTPFVNMSWSNVMLIALGWSSPGQLLQYHSSLPSKFVIIPRHSRAKYQSIIILDTEPCHIFHFGISQQIDDDCIEFNAVCSGPKFNMTFDNEIWLTNASISPGNLFTFKADLKSQKCYCSLTPSDPASVEFPTVHPYRHGLSNGHFTYLMASDREGCNIPFRDIIKVNRDGIQRQVWYSYGCVGEPVFVPSKGWDSWNQGDEDEGYIITQLYIPETHRTEFVVLNAKHIASGPVATIKLKHHIPYGFHGTFTPEVFLNPLKY